MQTNQTNVGRVPLVPNLGPVVLAVTLGMLAMGIPLPVLPGFVHDGLGYGPVMVGVAMGVQWVMTLLTRQFAGNTCDAKGPRASVRLGCLAASASGLAYLLAWSLPLGPGAALAVLFAGRIAMGAAEGLLITGGLAWGMARVPPRQAGQAMAWNGMAYFGALAIGAPIGAMLGGYGFGAVAVAGIVTPLVGLLVATLVPAAPALGGHRIPFIHALRWVLVPGSGLFFANVGFGCISAFLVLDFAANGWPGAGGALTAFAVGFVAMRIFFGHVPDRATGPRPTLIVLGVELLGQGMLVTATGPVMATLGAGLTGLGLSLIFPLLGVPAMRRVPPQNRGVTVGAYNVFMDLGIGLAGPVAGLIAAQVSLPAVFLLGATCAILAMVSAIATHRLPSLIHTH